MVSAAKVEQWYHLANKKSTFPICFNLPSWLLRSSLTMRDLHTIKQATWYMTCAPSPCLCLDHLFDQSSWFHTTSAIAFQSLQTKSRPPNTSNWSITLIPHTFDYSFPFVHQQVPHRRDDKFKPASAKVGNIPWNSQKYKVTIHSNCGNSSKCGTKWKLYHS
jgi:hypothetical protein